MPPSSELSSPLINIPHPDNPAGKRQGRQHSSGEWGFFVLLLLALLLLARFAHSHPQARSLSRMPPRLYAHYQHPALQQSTTTE